ncbi:YggT family protein [Ottowia sp. GY511]|uniref:YggT family protein n=1 Tax=Ottowia flava TaxID=2675430 RepID=A0ABW4KUN5_9BURK|nr:YggT family protein [Ottowia sp. GY511]TXK33623.1 YggT family protein [Ottowia sp. GY511]
MLFQVIKFLLEVASTLVGGACLLRMFMRWRAMSMANPVGRFLHALTDWLVLPLQRILPPSNRMDAAGLLGAWLLKMVEYAVVMAMLGLARWALLPVLALLGVVKLAASVATAVIVVAAILSWMQHRTPVSDVFDRLSAPLLAPVRRVLPLVGGVDLSPVIVVVLLQVVSIMLGAAQAQLLGSAALVAAG